MPMFLFLLLLTGSAFAQETVLVQDSPYANRCYSDSVQYEEAEYQDAINRCVSEKIAQPEMVWRIEGPTLRVELVDPPPDPPVVVQPYSPLVVAGHYLQRDGSPFYWFGCTAWAASKAWSVAEIDTYLTDASGRGCNVVQGPIFMADEVQPPWGNGANDPIASLNPTTFKSPHIDRIDYFVDRASQLGMIVAIPLVWGPHSNRFFEKDPVRAAEYTEAIVSRYAGYKNLVIIISGEYGKAMWTADPDPWNGTSAGWDRTGWPDAPLDTATYAMFVAMAEAAEAAKHPEALLTIHPDYWESGGDPAPHGFRGAAWLDLTLLQPSNNMTHVWEDVRQDYQEVGLPAITAETGYEDANPTGVAWDADSIRRSAYHSYHAGAAGYSYGNNAIWKADSDWQSHLNDPGRVQFFGPYRAFVLEHWNPANTAAAPIVNDPQGPGSAGFVSSMLNAGGQSATFLVSNGRAFSVNTAAIGGDALQGRWYDTVAGTYGAPFSVSRGSSVTLQPPSSGRDWALVVEPSTIVEPPEPPSSVVFSMPTTSFGGSLADAVDVPSSVMLLPEGHIVIELVANGPQPTSTAGLFGRDADLQALSGHLSIFMNKTQSGKNIPAARLQDGGNQTHLIREWGMGWQHFDDGVPVELIVSWGPSGFAMYFNGQLVRRFAGVTFGTDGNNNPGVIGALNWSAPEGSGAPIGNPFKGTMSVTVHNVEYTGGNVSVVQPEGGERPPLS